MMGVEQVYQTTALAVGERVKSYFLNRFNGF